MCLGLTKELESLGGNTIDDWEHHSRTLSAHICFFLRSARCWLYTTMTS